MKTRLIRIVAKSREEGVMWRGPLACKDGAGLHSARWKLDRLALDSELARSRSLDEIERGRADASCENCGAQRTPQSTGVRAWSGETWIYDTPSGTPEAGTMHWADWYPCAEGHQCITGWTNCDGKHLIVTLPNGYQWDVSSRCSNCDKRDDKTHRCWVRHGDPGKGEPVHVDKNGLTCNAGAGSIAAPGWHGFLHNGELTSC